MFIHYSFYVSFRLPLVTASFIVLFITPISRPHQHYPFPRKPSSLLFVFHVWTRRPPCPSPCDRPRLTCSSSYHLYSSLSIVLWLYTCLVRTGTSDETEDETSHLIVQLTLNELTGYRGTSWKEENDRHKGEDRGVESTRRQNWESKDTPGQESLYRLFVWVLLYFQTIETFQPPPVTKLL